MRRRVKAILKKVNRMEKQMKNKKAHIRKRIEKTSTLPPALPGITVRKHRKHDNKHQKDKSNTVASTFITTLAPTTIVQSPIVNEVKDTNQVNKVKRSHEGENGEHCDTHKDCAPGHCCHRFGLSGKSVCVKHELNLGSPCTNSCACAGEMKCVKFHNIKYPSEVCSYSLEL